MRDFPSLIPIWDLKSFFRLDFFPPRVTLSSLKIPVKRSTVREGEGGRGGGGGVN